jgi:hypothetical protein
MAAARYDRDRSAAIRTRHAGRPVCQVRPASRASCNEQMGLWMLTFAGTCAGSRPDVASPLPRKAFVAPPPVDSAVLQLRRRRR